MQRPVATSMHACDESVELSNASAAAAASAPCAAAYGTVQAFSLSYAAVHGYVSIVVCFAGLAANVVTTVVLTRRKLWSPTNAVLVSISAADIATIVVFIPHIAVLYVLKTRRLSRSHAAYELLFAHASLAAHTASVWLTVALGSFRCLTVRAKHGEKCCTFPRVGAALACVVLASVLVAVPQYLTLHVRQDDCGKWLVSNEREETKSRDKFLHEVQTWLVIAFVKVGPCLLLGALSGYLVRTMVMTRKSILRWRSGGGGGGGGGGGKRLLSATAAGGKSGSVGDRAAKRTTTMLAAVVVMFAVVGSPQAVLLLLSTVAGDDFFDCVYLQLADMFDLLTIINSSANFVIYCSMSKQFRDEFRGLLRAAYNNIFARRTRDCPSRRSDTSSSSLPPT